MLLTRAFIAELCRNRPVWPGRSVDFARTELDLPDVLIRAWLSLRIVATRTECVSKLVWYPSLVLAGMTLSSFTVEFGPYSFASNPVCLLISSLLLIASAVWLRWATEALRRDSLDWLEDFRSVMLAQPGTTSFQSEQIDHLIERVQILHEGAFAPYSQQPLVKAVLVPAASNGAAVLTQYWQASSG
jgi:hypothetical protein